MKERIKLAKKPKVVAVSGGFDPIHIGHVRMFEEAKKLGDKLVVILNNDNWLRKKKQCIFMGQNERSAIIGALKPVDRVVLTKHKNNDSDVSVCQALKELKPDIFANGGDRKPSGDPVPEVDVCKKLGIKMVYNIGRGGKMQSSSWLLEKYVKNINKKN